MEQGKSLVEELAKLKARIDYGRSALRRLSGRARDDLTKELQEMENTRKDLEELAGLAGIEWTIADLAELAQEKIDKSRRDIKNHSLDKNVWMKREEEPEPESETEPETEPEPHEVFEASEIDFKRLLADFVYFAKYCLPIVYRPGLNKHHPNGGFGPFIMNDAQERIVALIIELLLIRRIPVRVQLLKTRQLGSTTFWLALACWMMIKFTHFAAMLIIDKGGHARTKRAMVIRWFKHIKENFPGLAHIAHGGMGDKELTLTNGSILIFESAESPNPGTSEMIKMLIESEKPKWPAGRADQIKNSVTPGIPYAEMTIHIDESTAEGVEAFKRKWDRITSGTNAEEQDIIPIFLPWMLSNEYNIEPPSSCFDENNNFIFANNDSEVFDYDDETDSDLDEESYAKKYNLTIQQVYWRRVKIKGIYEGNRSGFDQEYPTTPDHAYRIVQTSFMPKRLIDYMKNPKNHDIPIRGRLLDSNGYVDITKPISYKQFSPKFVEDRIGQFYIREMPTAGETYFLGVDVAEGKIQVDEHGRDDPDYTIFTAKTSYGKTVAYYISRTKPEHGWYPLILFAMFYNMAWVNGERNNVGHTLLAFFWLTGYPNNIIQKKPKNSPSFDRAWTITSVANRMSILNNLRAALVADMTRCFVFESDEGPIPQFSNFIRNAKTGKPEASSGFHDDIIFSEALAEDGREWRYGSAFAKGKVNIPEEEEEVEEYEGFKIEDTDLGFGCPGVNPGYREWEF